MAAGARSTWPALVAARDAALVPAGVALAAGGALAALLEPNWPVGGLPRVLAYPKNVEIAAVLGGVIAGGAAAALTAWRAGRWLAAALAVAGYALLAWRWPQALGVAALALGAGAALAVALERALRAPPAPAATAPAAERAAALGWTALLAALLFVATSLPLRVDVFHDGEVLLTAHDLLAGGRPFASLQWPHGAHDSGVAALWMLATGKTGSSPVALTVATAVALAPLALVLLLGAALGGARPAALAAWLAVAALGLGRGLFYGGLALRTTGLLLFAALAFAFVARRRARPAFAGAALALAFVFRIDSGVFAAAAVLGALTLRVASAGGPLSARAVALARALAALALGAALAFGALRLLLGWPDTAWFAYTLGRLPRLHSLANGLPFPWPGTASGALVGLGALAILLPLILLGTALRQCVMRRSGDDPRLWLVAFLGLLALGGLRAALGRSDTGHLLHYSAPVLGATLLLCGGSALRRLAAAPRRAAWIQATLAAGMIGMLLLEPRRPLLQLAEHLRPNPPVGACGDRMFTAREAADANTARFIADTCSVEQLLRQHGIARLAFDHSAPWYQVRFGQLPPSTPFYSFNRAPLPEDQHRIIDAVRREAQALLKVRGYLALERYDVANAFRVPILEAYLQARRGGAPALDTPLGTLFLWNAPDAPPPHEASPLPDAGALTLAVDAVDADPLTGFVEVRGWAADAGARLPLAALDLVRPAGAPAEVRYGLPRPDLAAVLGTPRVAPSGFTLAMRLPPGATDLADVRMRLSSGDGRQRVVALASPAARRLPPLSGAAWARLRAEVDAAEALGRADRAAAVARAPRAGER